MKVKQIKTTNNQHHVAIEHNGELRSFFKSSSLHISGEVYSRLLNELGEDFDLSINFEALPKLVASKSRKGRLVYTQEGNIESLFTTISTD